MRQRIVFVPTVEEDNRIAADLAPSGFELVSVARDSPELRAAMPEADYLVGLGSRRMDDAFYKAAPKLKLVQLLSAGYDTCDIEAARRAGVPISNNGGANAIAVAEHTMLLILATVRRLIAQHTSVTGGRWHGNTLATAGRYVELHGRTLGVVGLGAIGKKVARLGLAFGMRVQYYDPIRLTEDAEDALGARFRLLDELFRTSDVVTLHVPLIPSTRHLVGAREFGLMKPTAYLVNTCRGPVVDEAALLAALSDGTIAGAGLDVFDVEPTPADNPLLALENVVLSPHLAGHTDAAGTKRFRNAFDNVQRVARGVKPYWVIPELRD